MAEDLAPLEYKDFLQAKVDKQKMEEFLFCCRAIIYSAMRDLRVIKNEDVFHNANVSLFFAIHKFTGKGTPEDKFKFVFIAYSKKFIKGAILKEGSGSFLRSNFTNIESNMLDSIPKKEQELSRREKAEIMVNEAKNTLSPYERSLVDFMLEGYQFSDIAKIYRMKKCEIDAIWQEVKNKIRIFVQGHEYAKAI